MQVRIRARSEQTKKAGPMQRCDRSTTWSASAEFLAGSSIVRLLTDAAAQNDASGFSNLTAGLHTPVL